MQSITVRSLLVIVLLTFTYVASAEDDPRQQRDELMEGVGDAAKVIGGMLKGENPYDSDAFMAALGVFHDASNKFGDLFPPGSETGMGTEAAPAIWEDRAGFDAAIAEWQDAVKAAIDANPGSLDEAKPVAGPVFNTCKGCHDVYRIEDE